MSEVKIYDNIQERAKKIGISINAIEKKANLGIGSLCKWNDVSPTVRNLKKVADILNCSVDELLKDNPSKKAE